jgi:rfaE bifunctional protein nucleotidyltransferase chain/domain
MILNDYRKQFEELIEVAQHFKKDKKKIVLCHGCFDPLHIGHVFHFRAAKKYGDVLLVTITPDCYVQKGETRPMFSDRLRLEMVKELKTVDAAAINLWESAAQTIKALRPDFFAKGMDYIELKNCNPNIISEKQAIEEIGGKVIFTQEMSFSSTELIRWKCKC